MKKYTTGQWEIFDDTYVRLKNNSRILTGQEHVANVSMLFFDRTTCEVLIREYLGNEDGEYRKSGETRIAHIPLCKRMLRDIEKKFREYKKDRVNEGYKLPEEMPEDMLNQKLMIEAELCIYTEELAKVESILETFVKEDSKESDNSVLQFGLLQTVHLRDGIAVKIDYQKVGKTEDGILIIDDPRSPFTGMSLIDYRELAISWKESERMKDEEELKRIQERARQRGLPVPQSYVSMARHYSISDLPAWPEGVVNHLQVTKTK